jgi:hypothetical protein
MELELQKCFEKWGMFGTINELKELFQQQDRAKRYEISQVLIDCKMAKGSSVSAHVIKLQGHIQRLEALGVPFLADFGTDMILKSLPPSFAGFVMNYNTHGMNKSIAELFVMLKVDEKDIMKSTNNLLLLRHDTQFKKKKSGSKKKGRSKGAGPSLTPKKKRPGPKADVECFICKENGHWKRNCPKPSTKE